MKTNSGRLLKRVIRLREKVYMRYRRGALRRKIADLLVICLKLAAEIEEMRRQRDAAQDARATFSLCPNCGGLVKCTGCVSPSGTCDCGYVVLESELEPVDPRVEVAQLREKLAHAKGAEARR